MIKGAGLSVVAIRTAANQLIDQLVKKPKKGDDRRLVPGGEALRDAFEINGSRKELKQNANIFLQRVADLAGDDGLLQFSEVASSDWETLRFLDAVIDSDPTLSEQRLPADQALRFLKREVSGSAYRVLYGIPFVNGDAAFFLDKDELKALERVAAQETLPLQITTFTEVNALVNRIHKRLEDLGKRNIRPNDIKRLPEVYQNVVELAAKTAASPIADDVNDVQHPDKRGRPFGSARAMEMGPELIPVNAEEARTLGVPVENVLKLIDDAGQGLTHCLHDIQPGTKNPRGDFDAVEELIQAGSKLSDWPKGASVDMALDLFKLLS